MATLRRPPPRVEKRDLLLLSCPPFVYTWPWILAGYGIWIAENFGVISTAQWAGPLYYGVILLVALAIGVPSNLWQSIFALLAVLFSWINIPYVSEALRVLFYRSGQVDAQFAFEMSNGLLVIYLAVLAYLWCNHYRVTSEALIEHRLGERDVATPRLGKQLRAEYPSVLRALFGLGAGDLVVRDANGDRVLMKINDVPFLYFRFVYLERKFRAYPSVEHEDEY